MIIDGTMSPAVLHKTATNKLGQVLALAFKKSQVKVPVAYCMYTRSWISAAQCTLL